jgi:hydrogenase-1 operon protein HyaF
MPWLAGETLMNLSNAIQVSKSTLSAIPTGNALPLLHEICHALKALVESGQETVIDLGKIPLGPGDELRLLAVLGQGEIEAQLNALGDSIIRETGISGVWLIEHFNEDEQSIGRFIEVTSCPTVLKSPLEDIRHGMDKLTKALANDSYANQKRSAKNP